jgi:polysaccharide chain length determinant protein (PEP-CTERM system associated)
LNKSVLEQAYFYINSVWQRRWIVVALAFAFCLIGWIGVAVWPNTYTATGKIYVDTKGVLGPLLLGLAVDPGLDAEAEVMKQTLLSRPNLEKLARETDRDVEVSTLAEREALTEDLEDATTITSNTENIFEIEFQDTDPKRARDSVQALIDIFVERNLGANRADMDSAHRFIDQQIQYYEGKLDDAEQRLANFKQRNVGLLPGPRGYSTRLEDAKVGLLEAQNALKDAVTTRDVLQEQLSSISPTIPLGLEASVGLGPPSYAAAQLAELEAHLGDLLRVYTEQHPQVVSIRKRIKELEKERQAEMENLRSAFEGNQLPGIGIPNPTFSQIKFKVIEQEALIATLRDRAARQQQIVDELDRRQLAVPVIEAEFSQLNRDYDVLKSKYEELLSRRESAKISGDREATGQRSQFRIVDPPVTPGVPSGPNRPLLLSAVLVLGVGAGIAVALGLSLLNSAYITVRQLREEIGLPVLGAISAIVDSRKKISRIFDNSLFAVCGVLIFFLYGGTMLVEYQVGLGQLSTVVRETGSIKPAIGMISEGLSSLSDPQARSPGELDTRRSESQ